MYNINGCPHNLRIIPIKKDFLFARPPNAYDFRTVAVRVFLTFYCLVGWVCKNERHLFNQNKSPGSFFAVTFQNSVYKFFYRMLRRVIFYNTKARVFSRMTPHERSLPMYLLSSFNFFYMGLFPFLSKSIFLGLSLWRCFVSPRKGK